MLDAIKNSSAEQKSLKSVLLPYNASQKNPWNLHCKARSLIVATLLHKFLGGVMIFTFCNAIQNKIPGGGSWLLQGLEILCRPDGRREDWKEANRHSGPSQDQGPIIQSRKPLANQRAGVLFREAERQFQEKLYFPRRLTLCRCRLMSLFDQPRGCSLPHPSMCASVDLPIHGCVSLFRGCFGVPTMFRAPCTRSTGMGKSPLPLTKPSHLNRKNIARCWWLKMVPWIHVYSGQPRIKMDGRRRWVVTDLEIPGKQTHELITGYEGNLEKLPRNSWKSFNKAVVASEVPPSHPPARGWPFSFQIEYTGGFVPLGRDGTEDVWTVRCTEQWRAPFPTENTWPWWWITHWRLKPRRRVSRCQCSGHGQLAVYAAAGQWKRVWCRIRQLEWTDMGALSFRQYPGRHYFSHLPGQ